MTAVQWGLKMVVLKVEQSECMWAEAMAAL